MNKEEMIEPLKTFNRRADEINKSEFCNYVYDNKNILNINFNEGNLSIKRDGPTIENIKAFTLDFRFFVQDKDNSFRALAKHYKVLPIPKNFKDMCIDLHFGFNNFLDNGKSIVKFEGKQIKFRELLWTFLYGKLAHEDDRYVGTVKQWTSNDYLTEFLWLDLILIFSGGFRNINALKELNEKVISYIEKNIP